MHDCLVSTIVVVLPLAVLDYGDAQLMVHRTAAVVRAAGCLCYWYFTQSHWNEQVTIRCRDTVGS